MRIYWIYLILLDVQVFVRHFMISNAATPFASSGGKMSISKKQKQRVARICKCGCGKTFYPFPVYDAGRGHGLRYPEYIRGHHPNCKKSKPAWNKNLTKDVCPTLSRMGFQPGHEPHCDWSHVNKKLLDDPECREKWLKSKQGQVPWNKGLTKKEYPNGIVSGEAHGNWRGNNRGVRDTSQYKEFVKQILKRDNYTCQQCNDHNSKGRGKTVALEVHHKVAVSEDPSRIFDPHNAITLCIKCHRETDNFGTKLLHSRRSRDQTLKCP